MSWWTYVERTKGADTQDAVAAAIGVKGSTVSRWRTGGADPRHVAAFARHYKRPVLEAFVAAGFLTEHEAKMRPAAAPSLSSLSDEELLDEVRDRLAERAGRGGLTVATAARKTGRAPAGQRRDDEQRAAELGVEVVRPAQEEARRRDQAGSDENSDEGVTGA